MIPILNIETTDDDSYEVAVKKDGLLLLYETLDGLTDYPIYDDEHLSQLEMQLADEAWDIWVECETIHDLTKIVSDLQADYQARMIDEDNTIDRFQYTGPTHADIDGVDQEWLREKYYELTYYQNYYPEWEEGANVYFPFHKEVVQELFNMIVGADNDRT
jgi:hypothetical protein